MLRDDGLRERGYVALLRRRHIRRHGERAIGAAELEARRFASCSGWRARHWPRGAAAAFFTGVAPLGGETIFWMSARRCEVVALALPRLLRATVRGGRRCADTGRRDSRTRGRSPDSPWSRFRAPRVLRHNGRASHRAPRGCYTARAARGTVCEFGERGDRFVVAIQMGQHRAALEPGLRVARIRGDARVELGERGLPVFLRNRRIDLWRVVAHGGALRHRGGLLRVRASTRQDREGDGAECRRGEGRGAARAAAGRFHRLRSGCYTPTHSNKRSARSVEPQTVFSPLVVVSAMIAA